MIQNVGSIDRAVRVIVGLALLTLVVVLDDDARWFGLVGLLPLLSGLVGNCPAYSIFGFSTCPLKQVRK